MKFFDYIQPPRKWAKMVLPMIGALIFGLGFGAATTSGQLASFLGAAVGAALTVAGAAWVAWWQHQVIREGPARVAASKLRRIRASVDIALLMFKFKKTGSGDVTDVTNQLENVSEKLAQFRETSAVHVSKSYDELGRAIGTLETLIYTDLQSFDHHVRTVLACVDSAIEEAERAAGDR